jgi:sulfatase maturation enzyme AslB (radical SAM superfamily)
VVEKMAEGVRFWRLYEERNRKRCKICKWGKYICNWGCGKMKIIL